MTADEQPPVAVPAGVPAAAPEPAAPSSAAGTPVATVAAAREARAGRPLAQASQAEVRRAAPGRADATPTAELPRPGIPAAGGTGTERAAAFSPPHERPAATRPFELPVLRIVCWQLALVLVFLAIGRPWPVAVGVLLAAAALAAGSAVRVDGRWLSDELALRTLLVLRRRGQLLPRGDGGRAVLHALVSGASVRTETVAGTPSGVISRAEEVAVVLESADAGAGVLAELALSGAIPAGAGGVADAGATEAGEAAQPVLRCQVVLHRGPQRTDTTRAWLVVRAVRDPAFAMDAELLVAVGNAVRKLRRRLRGTTAANLTTLSERELLATVAALTHTGPGGGEIREDRRYWRAGPIAQAGIRLAGLAPLTVPTRVQVLHRVLAAVPGTACTVSVTVPEYRAVVRVAATTDAAVDAATGWLVRTPPPGIRLERVDNQHAAAVAASLPIGGTP